MSAFFAGSIHAQLKVNSNGSVNLAATDNQTNKVSVGTPNYMSCTSTGLYSELTTLGGALNSAVVGNIQISGSATGKCAVGVCGSAYGGQLGLNYGVVGSAVVNGAGVYGTTYVNGQTYTQSLLIPSDIRLKTNVASFSDSETAGSAVKAKAMTAADIENATASSSVLFQNSPNPFKERTEIRFTIADGAKDACICIFDMQGKMLKRVAVSPTDTSIAIGSGELKAGMYLYTLIVDGQEIATRRMILNN